MKEPTCYIPFFNIRSKLLKDILGVKDMRSVKNRIRNLEVQIYGQGKDAYIITEEAIEAIRRLNQQYGYYVSKGKYSDL